MSEFSRALSQGIVPLFLLGLVGCGGAYDKYANAPSEGVTNSKVQTASKDQPSTKGRVDPADIGAQPSNTQVKPFPPKPNSGKDPLPATNIDQGLPAPGKSPLTTDDLAPAKSGDAEITPAPQPTPRRFNATFDGHAEVVQVGRKMILADDLIPVDVNAVYKMSVAVSANGPKASQSTSFVGFVCCDSNEQRIMTYHVAKFPTAVDTVLAENLNRGDQQIFLENATGWSQAGASYQRSMAWYPLTDGDTPQVTHGYTRHFLTGLWGPNAISNNVIRLLKPWPGPNLPLGTPVRNTMSGATYNYPLVAGVAVPKTPTTYSAVVSGVWRDGRYSDTQFRPGTKFIQPLVLADWGQDGKSTDTTIAVRDFLVERTSE